MSGAAYGVFESNPIGDSPVQTDDIDHSRVVGLSDPDLVEIVRLRLLTDPGCPFYDLSYCWGRMKDDSLVRVDLGRHQFPRQGLTRALVQCAIDAGRHGKQMGLLDAVSILR